MALNSPDLEGRTETPPVNPAPAETPDPATAEPEASAFIEQGGVRYVRAEALREKNEKLKERTAELKVTREAAQKYEAVKPYLGLLATHPAMINQHQNAQPDETGEDDVQAPPQRRNEPRQRRSGAPPAQIPQEEIAEFDEVLDSLGIDQKAGRKLVELVTHVADRRSARATAPLAHTVHRSIAVQARERMYHATDPNTGELFATREAIDEVLKKIPETMLTNDENISALLIQARGLGGSGGHTEPLHTEDVGRRGGARRAGPGTEPLSEFENRLMTAHGMKEDEYRKLSNQDSFNLE